MYKIISKTGDILINQDSDPKHYGKELIFETIEDAEKMLNDININFNSLEWKIMYFANDEHQGNYDLLMNRYGLTSGKDTQYEANIYIAAYPEIFKCVDLKNLDTSAGPLFSLMSWTGEDENDENGKHVLTAGGLTGSTIRLSEVGLSLYNGYKVRLDDVFGALSGEDQFSVFVQACKIRAHRLN